MEILKQQIFLAAFLVSLSGMPAVAAMPDAVILSGQLDEIEACAILDESALPEFKLSQEQKSKWLQLRQEHQILLGESCQALLRPDVQRISAAAQETGNDMDMATHAEALQGYQKHLAGFLMRLSDEQQTVLAETIRAQQHAAAELREKVILHSLML